MSRRCIIGKPSHVTNERLSPQTESSWMLKTWRLTKSWAHFHIWAVRSFLGRVQTILTCALTLRIWKKIIIKLMQLSRSSDFVFLFGAACHVIIMLLICRIVSSISIVKQSSLDWYPIAKRIPCEAALPELYSAYSEKRSVLLDIRDNTVQQYLSI